MTENPVLIETSFADAIAIIAASDELSAQRKRHWPTSLRQFAKWVDKPLEVIPARYSAVRADLAQLHQAPAGLTAKTLQNHKSNVKSALLWLAREKGIPKHGAPLTPAWEELRAKVSDGVARSRLSSLMRFCSANQIAPVEVDEAVVDRFIDYRSKTGMRAMMLSGVCWRERGTRTSGRSRAGRHASFWSPRSRLRWSWHGRSFLRGSGGMSIDICRV
jgi:hypothetical protein